MKSTGHALLCAVLFAALSCHHATIGPSPPSPSSLREVRVEALPPEPASTHVIDDPSKLDSIARSYAVSSEGWVESRGRELLPLYRLDLIARDGARATYWLGTNSHPPRFPCYALCSGWWIAPSSASGTLDASRFKGLPSSVYFSFLSNLGI